MHPPSRTHTAFGRDNVAVRLVDHCDDSYTSWRNCLGLLLQGTADSLLAGARPSGLSGRPTIKAPAPVRLQPRLFLPKPPKTITPAPLIQSIFPAIFSPLQPPVSIMSGEYYVVEEKPPPQTPKNRRSSLSQKKKKKDTPRHRMILRHKTPMHG